MGYACHAPDLFAGDFLLNLASEDDAHWERSITELQRVIDLTGRCGRSSRTELDPVVISSVGGFTTDRHAPRRAARHVRPGRRRPGPGRRLRGPTGLPDACRRSPWYMGGQLYCNLFVGAADTADFAERYGRRLCLDVSHSKLAANFLGQPFSEAVDRLAPHTEHLHLVDAVGVDGEGVQVGDGEIDWPVLAEQLDRLAPDVGFIPEIWQGHVNDGEGFWLALERLEEWF